MSARIRREIAYWFMLLLGITINSVQVYKYITNDLNNITLELCVLVIGICFNLFPRKIVTIFENKFINK